MATDIKDIDLDLESETEGGANPFDADFVEDEAGPEADQVMESSSEKAKARKPFEDPDLEDDDPAPDDEPKRDEHGRFVSTKPAEVADKKDATKPDESAAKPAPARPYLPQALIADAERIGIPADVAMTYTSARELSNDIFDRKAKLLASRGQGRQPEAKEEKQPAAAEPIRFEINERELDEPTVKVLRGAESKLNEQQSRIAKLEQTIADLQGNQEQFDTERRESAAAEERDRAAAMEHGFDEAVAKDDVLKEFLGRPAEVVGDPGSEKYARWTDPEFQEAIQYKLHQHFKRNPRAMPDCAAILKSAAALTWPDLATKQAQTELQKSFDKAKGSVAIKGADRAPVRRKPKNEQEDRMRFKADYERMVAAR